MCAELLQLASLAHGPGTEQPAEEATAAAAAGPLPADAEFQDLQVVLAAGARQRAKRYGQRSWQLLKEARAVKRLKAAQAKLRAAEGLVRKQKVDIEFVQDGFPRVCSALGLPRARRPMTDQRAALLCKLAFSSAAMKGSAKARSPQVRSFSLASGAGRRLQRQCFEKLCLEPPPLRGYLGALALQGPKLLFLFPLFPFLPFVPLCWCSSPSLSPPESCPQVRSHCTCSSLLWVLPVATQGSFCNGHQDGAGSPPSPSILQIYDCRPLVPARLLSWMDYLPSLGVG